MVELQRAQGCLDNERGGQRPRDLLHALRKGLGARWALVALLAPDLVRRAVGSLPLHLVRLVVARREHALLGVLPAQAQHEVEALERKGRPVEQVAEAHHRHVVREHAAAIALERALVDHVQKNVQQAVQRAVNVAQHKDLLVAPVATHVVALVRRKAHRHHAGEPTAAIGHRIVHLVAHEALRKESRLAPAQKGSQVSDAVVALRVRRVVAQVPHHCEKGHRAGQELVVGALAPRVHAGPAVLQELGHQRALGPVAAVVALEAERALGRRRGVGRARRRGIRLLVRRGGHHRQHRLVAVLVQGEAREVRHERHGDAGTAALLPLHPHSPPW